MLRFRRCNVLLLLFFEVGHTLLLVLVDEHDRAPGVRTRAAGLLHFNGTNLDDIVVGSDVVLFLSMLNVASLNDKWTLILTLIVLLRNLNRSLLLHTAIGIVDHSSILKHLLLINRSSNLGRIVRLLL